MGEVALRNLINQLNGVSDIGATNSITFRAELIVRESSLGVNMLPKVVEEDILIKNASAFDGQASKKTAPKRFIDSICVKSSLSGIVG